MDNKLRIKRVKEGIEMLEMGIDVTIFSKWSDGEDLSKYLGLSEEGEFILLINAPTKRGLKNGFRESNLVLDIDTTLHNWKRFLELIEKIK